jgi:hypothetical protein
MIAAHLLVKFWQQRMPWHQFACIPQGGIADHRTPGSNLQAQIF